ncbi:MAG: carbon monoxide dehydrogenase [Rhodospirillales bacterium]|nr:carbon monoxide dehydrogenase [Rhodospirillales bacterium]
MTAEIGTTSRALSRRSFLVTTGAVSIAVSFGSVLTDAFAAGKSAATFTPGAWVTIGTDGVITIMSPASEMGQGVMTTVPLLIAEDMDADWKKVRVVQSPNNAKVFGNSMFGGSMTTAGSRTVMAYYEKVRLVGAQTRKVLLANAASAWKVPVSELTTEPSLVVHKASGRKISYGDLAKKATVPDPLPEVTKADLKPAAQFRYIGKDVPRYEVASKVNGTAQYGIDTQQPNMLYGAVLRPPVQGETPEQIDDSAAKAIKGIVQIVKLPYGVGIIGETVEGTKKAKAALKVTWTNTAKARNYTSDAVYEEYRGQGADLSTESVTMIGVGDAAAAITGAVKILKADYRSDHVAHTCMEPMNATAVINGDAVEVWASNQSPTTVQMLSARAAGVPPEKVTVNTTLLGGGFGRRGEAEYAVDAVLLAKAVPGKPVKVIWSREDDVQYDTFRPLSAQHLEIGLDAANNIVGWRQRIVAESLFARSAPPVFKAIGGKDVVSAGGGELKYAVPAVAVEYIRADRGIAVGAWRGIAPGYVIFASETMIDEVATLKGVDPVAFRLDLLKAEPRAAKVVETAAKMADWGKKRTDGHALGIAYSDALNSHTAIVVEVSLNKQSGEIKVHHMWCAVDCGVAIQPKNIVAQIESSIGFGLGAALWEQINIEKGEVQESNFGEYRVMRMSDMPMIDTKVISTDSPVGGIGEASVAPVAPAIANAVATLTDGKRLRQLPMLPERVKAVLST